MQLVPLHGDFEWLGARCRARLPVCVLSTPDVQGSAPSDKWLPGPCFATTAVAWPNLRRPYARFDVSIRWKPVGIDVPAPVVLGVYPP
jgi:hypothetical protein